MLKHTIISQVTCRSVLPLCVWSHSDQSHHNVVKKTNKKANWISHNHARFHDRVASNLYSPHLFTFIATMAVLVYTFSNMYTHISYINDIWQEFGHCLGERAHLKGNLSARSRQTAADGRADNQDIWLLNKPRSSCFFFVCETKN